MSIRQHLISARGARRLVLAAVAVCLLAGAVARAMSRPTGSEATTVPARDEAAAAEYRVLPERIETADGWFPAPKIDRPKMPVEITRAFVIPIHGEIQPSTLEFLKRKVIRCRASKAQLVIFDMDTPGGRVDVMRAIVNQIRDELPGMTTVAYVTKRAMSAGAVISLACHEIVMAPRTKIGAATPLWVGPQGEIQLSEAARAKFEADMLADMRQLADDRGRSAALCEAMVTRDVDVWLIRHAETSELKIVDGKEWRARVRGKPDTPAGAQQPDTPWVYVWAVLGRARVAVLKTDEALRAGLSLHTFKDLDALRKHYNITVAPTVMEDTGSERLIGILTSQAVLGLLMSVALLCGYLEIRTPGFGIFGIIAIVCLAVVFGSRYIIGLAQAPEIAVFVLGVILLLIELFVTPGFGVLGITGILCCVGALLAMLIPNAPDEFPWPDTDMAWQMFTTGIVWLVAAVFAAVIGGALLLKALPRIPMAGRIILAPAQSVVAAPVPEESPMTRIHPGDTGVVEGPCRPVGKVRIGDNLVDAIAEGAMVDRGETVRVLRYEGNRLVVEKVEST